MTVTAPAPVLPGWDHYWSRMGLRGEWRVAGESPGSLGDREIWVDESVIDMIGRGDASPAVVLSQALGAAPGNWIGAVVRVNRYPAPVVYRILCRRWSQANAGRPYYVLAWPDLPSEARGSAFRGPDPARARRDTRGRRRQLA